MTSVQTTISRVPVAVKHEFPNESQNYIDEKIEEGQYKKRFRYQRETAQKAQALAQHSNKFSIMNMNSGDLYEKLLHSKRDTKEERFTIRPKKKLNTVNLHVALYRVKRQKELLDAKILETDKLKSHFKENDICMLAYSGAVEYVMNQHIAEVEADVAPFVPPPSSKPPRSASAIPRVKSAAIQPQCLSEEMGDYLGVEGKALSTS